VVPPELPALAPNSKKAALEPPLSGLASHQRKIANGVYFGDYITKKKANTLRVVF